jgi:predicted component of type VI protein secretion system
MRFRLRYLHHDLELSEGQFAVGRNASCQLSLDDPLVSRRHALLTVTGDGVTIEDLSSRNGVIVNGQKISGRVPLHAGDRILIGAQELTLLQGREAGRGDVATHGSIGKKTLPKVPTAPESRSSTTPPGTGEVPYVSVAPSDVDPEPSMVRRADAFNLLGSVAEKAFAMGRADEAERLLAAALADVIEASRAGKRMSPSLVDTAARFSAKLASSTSKGAWADYVIELYAAQGRPCPAPVIDELYSAFRKVGAVDLGRLRSYIATLRTKLPTFGPADRFLFQRIEGLERLAALK